LVAERVWFETSRALDEANPSIFFQTLRDCSVLDYLYPEIDALYGIPQTAKHHPEVDTGVHVMMALQKSADLGFDNETRFAVLMHDLGKATTPKEILPGHHGHEARGIKRVKALCQRLKIPKAHTELALITTEYHTHVHRAFELKATTLLNFFSRVDIFRKPERFRKMLNACLADARGRKKFDNIPYPQVEYLSALADILARVDISPIKQKGLQGRELGDAIRDYRLNLIKAEKNSLRRSR